MHDPVGLHVRYATAALTVPSLQYHIATGAIQKLPCAPALYIIIPANICTCCRTDGLALGLLLQAYAHRHSNRYVKYRELFAADGIEEQGSSIMYKANVRRILTEGEGDHLKAVGVQLLDGRTFKGQVHPC